MGKGKESKSTAPIGEIAHFYFDDKIGRWRVRDIEKKIEAEEAERQKIMEEAYQEVGGPILRRVDQKTLDQMLEEVKGAKAEQSRQREEERRISRQRKEERKKA